MEIFEKKWPYMYDRTFRLKWNVIEGIINKWGSWPVKVLDLGCGPINIIDSYIENDIDHLAFVDGLYLGIDSDSTIIEYLKKENFDYDWISFLNADYQKLDIRKIGGKFNILLWTGIPDRFGKHNAILKKYLPLIEKGGVIILDYQATSPVGVSKRVSRNLPMRHVTGCELKLPYLPKSKFPNHKAVNHRIIEVFKKT